MMGCGRWVMEDGMTVDGKWYMVNGRWEKEDEM
jgi:hypothetical protein